MSIDLRTLAATSDARAPVIFVYGVGGIGKTTWASAAPDPVFLMTEDGLISPHLSRCPYLCRKDENPNNRLVRSFEEMIGWLDQLATGDHDWNTVVIDSLDAFEPIVNKYTIEKNGWTDIESPGFGKGYIAAEDSWRRFLDAVMRLRNDRGMMVILIGHNQVNTVTMPDAPPYSQYAPALHKRAAKLVHNLVDATLFAMRPVNTVTDEGKFSSVKHTQVAQRRAVADEPRLYAQERGGWVAKNRFDMPEWVPFHFSAFAQYVPFLSAQPAPPIGAPKIKAETAADATPESADAA